MHRVTAVWGVALLVSTALLRAQSVSTAQNPTHTFSTPGSHQVTLQSCTSGGCDTITKTVTVLDPVPAVTSAVLGIATAEAGQLLQVTGSGTGKPPLTYTWRVLLGTSLVREVTGATAWLNTTGLAPGAYVVVLRITNTSGQAESLPKALHLIAPKDLDFYTVNPCRVLDTRTGSPLVSGTPRVVAMTGVCGIPAGARAVVVNLTAVGVTGSGHLAGYPGNYPPIATNAVSFSAGKIRTSSAVLPLATDGSGTLALFAPPTGGTVHAIVDVTGYFAE